MVHVGDVEQARGGRAVQVVVEDLQPASGAAFAGPTSSATLRELLSSTMIMAQHVRRRAVALGVDTLVRGRHRLCCGGRKSTVGVPKLTWARSPRRGAHPAHQYDAEMPVVAGV